jgi:hypothetical protein
MIVNGFMLKCGGQSENVKLQIGEYYLKTHMFTIDMGGYDVVVGVEWLDTLGPITLDFKDFYMSLNKEGWKHTIKGITSNFLEMTTSHWMEKLLKKYHLRIIA